MNPGRVIIRKIADDPMCRKKAYAVLRPEHFIDKRQRWLFDQMRQFKPKQILTIKILLDHATSKGFKEKTIDLISQEIGAIFTQKSPLTSEFAYAVKAIAREAQIEKLSYGLQRVADLLNKGDLEGSKALLKDIGTFSEKLSISSDRFISARTMAQLPKEDASTRFFTGFKQVDEITGGGRLGDLWLWGAYTGEMKTTCLLAAAHHLLISGNKVFFVSLEMDDVEIRHRLICQHCCHMGRQIPYREIEQKTFSGENQGYYERAVADFDSNPAYGQIVIWRPELGVNILDVTRALESCCDKTDCDVLVLDYVQKLTHLRAHKEIRVELNETLDKTKRLAMEARSGKGIWVLSGYQTSTDGRKKAEAQGFYDIWALSETIGAGQISNVIVWSLVTEAMREQKEMKVGIAKSRNTSIEGSKHFLAVDPSVGLVGREPIHYADESMQIENLDDISEEA